jgi:peptidyl-prolyl cis-trans isomerase C
MRNPVDARAGVADSPPSGPSEGFAANGVSTMNRRMQKLFLAAGLSLFTVGLAMAEDTRPVARIDGTIVITEEDVSLALSELGTNLPAQMTDEQKRNYAIEYLMDLKIVARAAEREKIAETPEFRRRLEQTRERILMETLLTREGDKGKDEAALRKFYDDTVKTLKAEPEVRARHILVETEEEAKKALERVTKGEDFAAVAKEISKDPGSGTDGGDLGFFTKDRMVADFAEEAFKTPVGKISGIVKTQFGFHIIKVEETRDRAPPPFEQVRAQLVRYMTQKAQQDYVLKLRSEAKVEKVETPK